MEAYTTRIKTTAEALVKDTFPQKALELDDLVNSDQLNTLNICKVFQESDLPKVEDFLPTGMVLRDNDNFEKENLDELVNTVAKKTKNRQNRRHFW